MATPSIGSVEYYMTQSPIIRGHLACAKGHPSEESIRKRIAYALERIPEAERGRAIFATRSREPDDAASFLMMYLVDKSRQGLHVFY